MHIFNAVFGELRSTHTYGFEALPVSEIKAFHVKAKRAIKRSYSKSRKVALKIYLTDNFL